MNIEQLEKANALENNVPKVATMQELGMCNAVHLCDSCCDEQPECSPSYLIFGTGKGNDNVVACDIYVPLTKCRAAD